MVLVTRILQRRPSIAAQCQRSLASFASLAESRCRMLDRRDARGVARFEIPVSVSNIPYMEASRWVRPPQPYDESAVWRQGQRR